MQQLAVGSRFERIAKYGCGRDVIRFLQIGRSEIAFIPGITRTDLQCSAKGNNGSVTIAGLEKRQAQIILTLGILRLNAKRLTERRGGIRGISDSLQR